MTALRTMLLLPLVTLLLSAQDVAKSKAPEFAHRPPAGYVAAIDADFSQTALDALLTTSLGKIAADEEVVKFLAMYAERYRAKRAEISNLQELAKGAASDQDFEEILADRLADLEDHLPVRARAWLFPPEEKGGEGHGIVGLLFKESSSTELKRILEGVLDAIKDTDEATVEKSGKIGDSDVYTLKTSGDDSDPVWFALVGSELWVGIDAVGWDQKLETGDDAGLAAIWKTAPQSTYGLAGFTVDVTRALEAARRKAEDEDRPKIDKTLGILGVEKLSAIHWTASVEGENLRETMHLVMPEDSGGLFKALVPSGATQGAPKVPGAPISKPIASLNGRMDPKGVLDGILQLAALAEKEGAAAGLEGLSREDIEAAFDGSYALVVGKPTLLSPVPKVALSLGVKSLDAVNKLLEVAEKKAEGITFERSQYKEQTLTTIIIPNDSSGTAPSFTILNGVFYLSDSPKTLKTLMRDIAAGKTVAELEGLPSPLPFADVTPTVTVNYAVDELVKLLYGQVMTLASVGISQLTSQTGMKGILSLGELPSPATIASYLASGNGGAAWRKDGLYLSVASPLGDPLLVTLASTLGPMGLWGAGYGMDMSLSDLKTRVGGNRVEKLRDGLNAWKASFGGGQRWPESLSELLVRGLIEDQATFTMPGDEAPLALEYQGTSGGFEKLATSFRYLPNSKLVVPADTFTALTFGGPEGAGMMGMMGMMGGGTMPRRIGKGGDQEAKERTVILYEHRDSGHGGRMVLCDDGSVFHFPEALFKSILSLSEK